MLTQIIVYNDISLTAREYEMCGVKADAVCHSPLVHKSCCQLLSQTLATTLLLSLLALSLIASLFYSSKLLLFVYTESKIAAGAVQNKTV